MKKYIIAFVFVFFVGSFSITHASQYPTIYSGSDAAYWQQYFGPGYSLKQQQDKDALEYRLNSLEAQIQGDPQAMITTIDARISALQTQRDQEINAMRDTYANHGIMIQFDSKLAEINAKYDSQISTLQQQKNTYTLQIANEQKRQQEIADIKKQIEDVDKNADAAIQKVKDDLAAKNQKALNDSTAVRVPTAQEAFDYLDSLSLHDASIAFQKLNSINPDLASQTTELYKKKYPNGKAGTALNDENQASIKPTTKAISNPYSTDKETKSQTKEPTILKKGLFDDIQVSTASTTQETKVEPTPPVQQKEGFVSKVFHFFKKLVFWK